MTTKQQHAARARQKFVPPSRKRGPVSTDLLARKRSDLKVVTGPIRRTTALKGTAAMRDGDTGRRSLWAAPAVLPYSVSAIANDGKWTATVSG